MKKILKQKITESIIPVILLLSGIFFLLLYVEYRASQDADKAQHIHITADTMAESTPENEIAGFCRNRDYS